MATIVELCQYLHGIAPLDLAEDWDNVGLLVGKSSAAVERVMTCLSITAATVREAVAANADLVVTHHPLPFRSLKRITDDEPVGQMLLELIANQVAIYSAHTAFDSASGGINQQLADGLDLIDVRPLCTPTEAEANVGTGRAGSLPLPQSLDNVAAKLKSFLGIPHVRAVGGHDLTIQKIGIACGSAGQFIEDARREGCELLVTGETSFHTCLQAQATQIGLLLLGHFASERFAMETLADRIAADHSGLTVWVSRSEADPLRLV